MTLLRGGIIKDIDKENQNIKADEKNKKMDNQLANNTEDFNIFFQAIGFDKETVKDQFKQLGEIIFISAAERLDAITIFKKDKKPFPEMKSPEDFFNYYGEYTDKETIKKVLQEETHRVFSKYFKTISEYLPE